MTSAPRPEDRGGDQDHQHRDSDAAAGALKPVHLSPCNVVVALAGYRRETRRITLDLDPVRACRLADLELRSGMSAEAILRDLLDDAIFSTTSA